MKKTTSFAYPPELLDRVRRYSRDQHRTVTITLELLLDDALTRAGYPRTDSPQDTAGPE